MRYIILLLILALVLSGCAKTANNVDVTQSDGKTKIFVDTTNCVEVRCDCCQDLANCCKGYCFECQAR